MVMSGITGEGGAVRGPDSSVGVEQLNLKWNETLIGKALDFDDVTLAAGSTVNILSMGDSTAKEVTITDYWLPFRMNIASVANPSAARLAALMFLKFATTTAHQAYLDIQGIGLTIDLGKNVGYAHGFDVGVSISETLTATNRVSAIKATIDLTSSKVLTCHDAAVIFAQVTGAGTQVGTGGVQLSVLELRVAAVSTIEAMITLTPVTGCTVASAIRIAAQGTITYLFDSANVAGTTAFKVGASCQNEVSDGAIKIKVGETAYYIPFFTAGNTDNSW